MKRSLLSHLFSFIHAPALLSATEYTRELARSLKAASPFDEVIVQGELALCVTNSVGVAYTARLDSGYQRYLQEPQAQQSIMKSEIDSIFAAQATGNSIEKRRIVPLIKSRAWLNEVPAEKHPDYVTEDLNEQLVVVYVEDQRKTIRYLSPAQLAQAGVKREELRALALENLMRLLPQVDLHKGPLVSMLTAGGNYEASLLLVKDFWGAGKVQVTGEIVVAVPSRDVVLITGSANADGLAHIRKLARASRPVKASYQLTDTLFVYRNGRFVKF